MTLLSKIKRYKKLQEIRDELKEWETDISDSVPIEDIIEKLNDKKNIKYDGDEIYIELEFKQWNKWVIINHTNYIAQPHNTNKLIIDYLKLPYGFKN